MNIESWLDQYGCLAVFFGVIIEGPITLSLAGFLAHQGYLNSLGVLAAAWLSTFLAVEIAYYVGLLSGQALARRPFWRRQQERLAALIDRFRTLFMLGFRFSAGSHTVIPVVIGMTRMRPGRFASLSAAGATVWTLFYFLVGYFFGHTVELVIEDIKRHELAAAAILTAVLLALYLFRRLIFRRVAAKPAS